MRPAVPHGDEDEADDKQNAGCCCSDSGSCRCARSELASGKIVEYGRHCCGGENEVWNGSSEVGRRFLMDENEVVSKAR